ncbi:hypothetical protein HDV00_011624 [Rhizophlyctis rosea]|nr:hypothetical protein HDV00_011624 [Rhizophlyctis rosea]
MKVAALLITALAAAQAVAAKTVYIYGSNVNVRSNSGSCATKPSTSCKAFTSVTRVNVEAKCQRQGSSVTISGVGTNNWWTLVKAKGQWGWVTNLYIRGGHKISGVPDCTSSSTPAPSKPAPSTSRKHSTSTAGRKFIEEKEGFRAYFYGDIGGVRTIGYGHACQGSACNGIHAPLSKSQGDALLTKDLKKYEGYVNTIITTPLTQNQFDALVSFTFNEGPGALRNLAKYLNKRQFTTAQQHWIQYDYVSGVGHVKGLHTRRVQEIAMFNKK